MVPWCTENKYEELKFWGDKKAMKETRPLNIEKYLEISYFELKNKQTKPNNHNSIDLCTLETKKTSEMTISEPFSEISVATYELWQDCSDHNQILQRYSFYRNF